MIKKKLQSRKFWVWLVWGMITMVCLFSPLGDFNTAAPIFGAISFIYLGVEGYIDSIYKKKEVI